MKKPILLTFLLIACHLHSQFKEATLIFIDNVTVDGFGEIKNNKIYFKAEKDSKADEWSFEEVKGIIYTGYGFSEKYEYVKPDKNSRPQLFEVVDEGKVNLYLDVFVTNSFMTFPNNAPVNSSTINKEYYLKRNEEQYATSFGWSFKKNAQKYFSDCEIVVKKINAKKFTQKNIDEMVDYYNNYCDGENPDSDDEE